MRALLKDMAGYLPAHIVPAVVAVAMLPVITRLFPPADYGAYRLVLATLGVLGIGVGWIAMAVIRFFPAYERDGRLGEFTGSVLFLAATSVLALLSIAGAALRLFGAALPAELQALMWPALVAFGIGLLSEMPRSFLRSRRQLGWFSALRIWNSIAGPVIGIAAILTLGMGISALLWGAAAAMALAIPLLWRKAFAGISPKLCLPRSLVVDMARYSLPLVGANLAAWVLKLGDRYVIQGLSGSHAVGVYSASYGVADRTIFVLTSLFLMASGPLAMRTWETEGQESAKAFVADVTRYFLVLCVPAVVALSVLARPITALLFPAEYAEGYRVIPFVAGGALLVGLQQRYQAGPAFLNRTEVITLATVLSGLANIALNLLLVPRHGYMGAAYATCGSYALFFALMVYLSRRLFVWPFPFRTLRNVLLAAGMAGMVAYFVGIRAGMPALMGLVAGSCAGAALYLGMLCWLGEFNKAELLAVRDIARRLGRKNAAVGDT